MVPIFCRVMPKARCISATDMCMRTKYLARLTVILNVIGAVNTLVVCSMRCEPRIIKKVKAMPLP